MVWGGLERFVKLVEGEHVELREWNLLEVVEVAVLGDDIVGISVEDYVAHRRLEGLVWRAQMLAAQFVEFLLVEGSLVPHLVDSPLCPLGEEERKGKPQGVKILLRSDVGRRVHQFQLCHFRVTHIALYLNSVANIRIFLQLSCNFSIKI